MTARLFLLLLIGFLAACDSRSGGPSPADLPNARTAAMVGKEAPNFTLPRLEGEAVELSQHRKKEIVVLDFWATWCGPCRQIMPFLEQTAHDFRNQGVVVYSVNQGESKDEVLLYLRQLDFEPQTLLDPRANLMEVYKIEFIPLTMVIDKDGIVAGVYTGITELKEQLKPKLRELVGK